MTLLCWITDFRHRGFSSVLYVEPFKVRRVQKIRTALSCFGKERGEAVPVEDGHLAVPRGSLSQSRMFAWCVPSVSAALVSLVVARCSSMHFQTQTQLYG